ncbi:hypothetical protein ZHAS_00015630 [Anopheles sinensis]|uniref:Uncharacterized protein n=1 Tax=Anopheles sinensis TaxID=74873 RepID=A0A084WAZ0_ANOSI|nr:hypothetical protein ZHAS_00015630 [Anopheles sinensis]
MQPKPRKDSQRTGVIDRTFPSVLQDQALPLAEVACRKLAYFIPSSCELQGGLPTDAPDLEWRSSGKIKQPHDPI